MANYEFMKMTNLFLDLVDSGAIDPKQACLAFTSFLSDDQISDFMKSEYYELIPDDDENDDDEIYDDDDETDGSCPN